jgi:hypothetical protein
MQMALQLGSRKISGVAATGHCGAVAPNPALRALRCWRPSTTNTLARAQRRSRGPRPPSSSNDAVAGIVKGSTPSEYIPHKILRYHLVGAEEHVAGHLGQALGAALRHSQIRSALKDVLGRAMLRRRVLNDVSVVVADVIASGEKMAETIRNLLKANHFHTNGLADCSDLPLSVPPRLGGLRIVPTEHLSD